MLRPIIAGIVLAGIIWPPAAGHGVEPTADEIAAWIAQLGSAKFAEREAAAGKLAALGTVPSALRAATQSSNAEVARRARGAVAKIERRLLEKRFEQDLARINAEGLDLFIERMVKQPGFATQERWQVLERLAEVLATEARALGPVGYTKRVPSWLELPVLAKLPDTMVHRSRVLLDGLSEDYTAISQCLVVSSRTIGRVTGIDDSVVLVNGDLAGCTGLSNCVVLCTGKIGHITSVQNSIVLAAGEFAGSTGADDSLFQVKSVGRHTSARGCTYVNLKVVPGAGTAENKFPQTDRGPRDAVKFFDPAHVGVRVKQVGDQTHVEALTEKSPLRQAGLRAGDELISVGGKKWNTPEEFRAVLMRCLMQEKAALRARRGERIVEVTVNFK